MVFYAVLFLVLAIVGVVAVSLRRHLLDRGATRLRLTLGATFLGAAVFLCLEAWDELARPHSPNELFGDAAGRAAAGILSAVGAVLCAVFVAAFLLPATARKEAGDLRR
jgi:hypothetical protein